MRYTRLPIVAGLLATLVTATAGAQNTQPAAQPTEPRTGLGFGVKAGFGFTPDQFVIGAQYALGKKVAMFRVVPNANLGFGDLTTFDISVDFLVRGVLKDSGLILYGGIAPTFVTWSGGDESSSDFGGTLIGGVMVPLLKKHSTAIEGRFGIGDIPDFRLVLSVIL